MQHWPFSSFLLKGTLIFYFLKCKKVPIRRVPVIVIDQWQEKVNANERELIKFLKINIFSLVFIFGDWFNQTFLVNPLALVNNKRIPAGFL